MAIEIDHFIRLFEHHSGHTIEDLRSPLRARDLVSGRIELTTLAVSRRTNRSTDVARVIRKHPASVARWIKLGLLNQQEGAAFGKRIDHLDCRISSSAYNNA